MYKFLLIEDSADDAQNFQDTVKRLNASAGEEIYHLEIAATYDEGVKSANDDFHGIIVDVKLDGDCSGNVIVEKIVECFRVPVAIFTGTPDTNQDEGSPIKVYKKGETLHEDILKELCAVSETGLFKVLGGTGTIEKAMTKIFWDNLYPQIDIWKEKKQQGIDTEKVLLRYAISHIQELIEEEIPSYVTEEMYIKPPVSSDVKTGSIFKSEDNDVLCIVLSPPCDLAKHNGRFKTDRILLCEIDSEDEVNKEALAGIGSSAKKKNKIESVIKNNYKEYYHYLPRNTLFEGGYVNFRKVLTYEPSDFLERFGKPKVKVQDFFVKNILNRFSAYYARQGQPDFDFRKEAEAIYDKMQEDI